MISVETLENAVRIAIHGELVDDERAPSIAELLKSVPLVRSNLIIDVSKCTAMTAAGVTLLVRLMHASVGPCELRVAEDGQARELLDACGFSALFARA